MLRTRALDALLDSYQDFDIGQLQKKFDEDKKVTLVKRPVPRYSYALVRAALNVFVQRNFADNLNRLAFDKDGFREDVQNYVAHVWPHYLEEARDSLNQASIQQLCPLEFKNWKSEGKNCFGAWHRLDFFEFKVDVILQVSNPLARLGAFEGLCFLANDLKLDYQSPEVNRDVCEHLGSSHLQTMADGLLGSLGISPESAIAAIKWQMGR